jgi:UDP-GlcNAc:undecaprenyl-phosphate GlcNAc-1-phosphate transferase
VTIVFLFAPALAAAILSFLLTPLARRISIAVGAIDLPGPRKIHDRPIPRLGGLAVVGSFLLVGGFLCVMHFPRAHPIHGNMCAAFGLGVLPILLVSLRDDVESVGVVTKFLAHFAGAGIAISFGITLAPKIHLLGLDLNIGWLAIPLSFLWIVGVTNAFNIVDGLDGLSAGLALISAASLVGVSFMTGRATMASIALVLSGSLVGFLPFNLFPAKIFLGDTGATAAGFWLACLALSGGSTLSAGMAVLIPIFLIGVPLAETLVSMLRRLLRRLEGGSAAIFQADREHIHHRLLAAGITQRRAVTLLYGAGLLAAGAGLFSVFLSARAAALLLVTLLAATVIGITRLNYDEFALVRRGVILRIYDAPVLKRALFPVFFDLAMVALASYAAIVLKWDDWGLVEHRALAFRLVEILPPVTLVTFWSMHLYRGAWRQANIADLLRSSLAVTAAAILGGVVVVAMMREPPPATFGAIYLLSSLALTNGSRASYRLFSYLSRRASSSGISVVIYGAGLGGTLALREILSNKGLAMKPLGFIDDDPSMVGRLVNGYPVLGSIDNLSKVLEASRVEGVVVATEKISRENLLAVEDACRATGARISRFRVQFDNL